MTLQEKVDALDNLAKELDVRISGCGCCGSPWAYDISGEVDRIELGWPIEPFTPEEIKALERADG